MFGCQSASHDVRQIGREALVVLPAVIMGIVAAIIAGRYYIQMIQTYSDLTTRLSWWLFASGALLVMMIVYTVNVVCSYKAANENPVEAIS